MSLPPLTIIPAGAGSGKTYKIQEQLGAWVEEGKVAPERIVAVTFTEAAAAELRERISAKLLSLGRVDEALRLNQAYISTIHGLGLRILTEFAFEGGNSPQPRLLNDDEKNTLIRLALARTDSADPIISDLASYGYKYDYNGDRSAENVFRDEVLRIVELLRTLGSRSDISQRVTESTEWIKARYGPTGDGDEMRRTLISAIEALLHAYPECLVEEFGKSQAARDDFRRDFRNLRRAQDGEALRRDWELWQGLRDLRLSKRGNKLPDDYDALGQDVIAAADELPHHPGPLAHAMSHIEGLLRAGDDVVSDYSEAKRDAGLVDYTDMIAMAGRLLRERPDVRQTLASRVDCLVIDEFQDTNPLQFALLWTLYEAGVPTMVVGDLKQAIMGFQGADPRLLDELQRQNPKVSSPLTRNWRSQAPLMEFINALGPGLFKDAYVHLAPQVGFCPLGALEAIAFDKYVKKDWHAIRAVAVGQRLKDLLEDSSQSIIDRHTGKTRQLRGSDLAVLCPTNTMLEKYAAVLRAQGLRVRIQANGWFSSRAVQIAWHALAYLANPADRHAALYLAVTELGSLSLEEALRQLMEAGRVEDPILEKLDALAEGLVERTVYVLVADMLAALDLFGVAMQWPDAEQARANLLRLLAEAGEFMEANREALAHGGFHGSGVETFMAWLAAIVEENDEQPEAHVLDEDAVVLTTWHSSKGREWPVVAVCGLDRPIKATLPNLELGYTSFERLSELLDHARIEYAPAFSADEANQRFLSDLQTEAEISARRLLYVAMTRARDKMVLEWPRYLAKRNSETITYWSILAGDCRVSVGEGAIRVGDEEFSCFVTDGKPEVPEEIAAGPVEGDEQLPIVGRRAIQIGAMASNVTPDSTTPSAKTVSGTAVDWNSPRSERYGNDLDIRTPLMGAQLGTFLHRCFEVLGPRPGLLSSLPAITGIELDKDELNRIAAAVGQFEAWLASKWNAQTVLREWPVLFSDDNGTVVSGTADLIIRTPEGVWIIDHKSDQVDDPVKGFATYQSQLASYARGLGLEGEKVLGVGVNWIRRGEVLLSLAP